MRENYLLPTGNPELSWQAEARCATEDPVMFIQGPAEQALAICALCPVRQQCLDYAVENDERFGVWGGVSAEERARRRGDTRPATIKGVVDELLQRLRG